MSKKSNTSDIKVITSKVSKVKLIGNLLFLGLLGVVIIILTKSTFSEIYYDFPALVFLIATLIFTFLFIKRFLLRPKISISRKEIIVQSIFGTKTYTKDKIQGYQSEKYEGKNLSGETSIIKINKSYFKLDSNTESNYYDLRGMLNRNYPVLEEAVVARYDFYQFLWLRIFFFLIFALCTTVFINMQLEDPSTFETQLDYHEITLSEAPILKKTSGRSSERYILLKAKNHKAFKFKIQGKAYTITNKPALLQSVKQGYKIAIGIKREDLAAKLLKNKEPDYWTKHYDWKEIIVYSLRYNDEEYINLHRLKKALEGKKNASIIILLLGLFALFLASIKYNFFNYKNI